MGTLSRRQPLVWGLAGLVLVVLLVVRAPGFSGVLLGAFILAYVCAPVVDRLDRRLPRALAAGLVLVAVGIVALGMLLLFVPLFTTQYRSVAERLPQILDAIERLIPRFEASFGIDLPDTRSDLALQLREQLTGSGGKVAETLGGIAGRTFGGAAGILGGLVTFGVLVPMVGFYLLLNYHDLWPNLATLVPARHVARVTAIKNEIDNVLGGFVRGQLTVAALIGAILATGFSIVGIDGALVIGLLGGFLNMIPIAGAVIGYTLAILMAILKFAGWAPIIGVVVVIVVSAVLEQMVITPRILGGRVGLPPLAVLLAVMGAGELFGFAGMLLAVPAAAIIKVVLGHARQSYMDSEGYRGGEAAEQAPAVSTPIETDRAGEKPAT